MWYSLLLHAIALSMLVKIHFYSKQQAVSTQPEDIPFSAELMLQAATPAIPVVLKKKRISGKQPAPNNLLLLIHDAVAAALTQLDFDHEDHTRKVVELEFSIDSAGVLSHLQVSKSSGDTAWDQLVVTAAQDASPIAGLSLKNASHYRLQIFST